MIMVVGFTATYSNFLKNPPQRTLENHYYNT